MDKLRSTVTNNLALPESATADRLPDSLSPMFCHGPLCKSFICYIDTLAIGHSVLIQLKAVLRFNHFRSVSCSPSSTSILDDLIRPFRKSSYTRVGASVRVSMRSLPVVCMMSEHRLRNH